MIGFYVKNVFFFFFVVIYTKVIMMRLAMYECVCQWIDCIIKLAYVKQTFYLSKIMLFFTRNNNNKKQTVGNKKKLCGGEFTTQDEQNQTRSIYN